MPTMNRASPNSRNSSWGFPSWSVGASGLLLVAAVLFFASPTTNPISASTHSSDSSHGGTKVNTLTNVTPIAGVDSFYHCAGERTADGEVVDLIMLHGAAFTKEDWKTSGILSKLCLFKRLNVIALDLDDGGSYKDLKAAIDGMRDEKILETRNPVSLVTPSMSGSTVTGWLESEDEKALFDYIGNWIPVAAVSVSRTGGDSLKLLKGRVKTLALYGSRDTGGKATSMRLQKYSNAKVVESEGGHPCYLDSPDDFVQNIRDFLAVD